MNAPTPPSTLDADLDALRQIAGAQAVSDDEATRALFSQDIWSVGSHCAQVVVAPADTQVLAAVVAEAARRDFTLAVRGGGMSYTSGYTPTRPRTLLLDMSQMDRVLRVDAQDMTVTVQAGCTWKTLNETLKPLGLRTPFWGPLSGITSTVGGGLSQQNAIFGSGHYGTTSESVVAVKVVLADGQVLATGARGADGETPFFRHFGSDLTGLFCGDCGAYGIKAEITLRLIRTPAHEGFASFAFASREQAVNAMAEMVRAGLAAEICGFDPGLAAVRLKRASILSGVQAMAAVATTNRSLLAGLKAAAGIALAGRGFLAEGDWSIHLGFEGRSETGVREDVAAAKLIALAAGGAETEASIPKILRAQPFTPLNNILGPDGERWAPVHGIVSLSNANPCFEALEALFASYQARFEAAGIYTGYMLTSLSTNGFLIEPVFFWPEARRALHEANIEPAMLAKLKPHDENPAATALVTEARAAVVAVFQTFGAAHFQVGRTYPWLQSRDAASQSLARAVKAALDPEGRLNPGVLGL